MSQRRIRLLRGRLGVAALALAWGGQLGCAWLSGFDGENYALLPSGTGGGGASGGGGAGANATGGSGGGQGGVESGGGGAGTGAAPTGGGGSAPTCVEDIYTGPENRVFVLHNKTAGDFGDLEAGDAICQAAADSCMPGATWKAYLSVSGTPANSRLPPDSAPWYMLDEQQVFMFHTNLKTGPFVPIDIDEFGRKVQQGPVWTGTLEDGNPAPAHCGNWGGLGSGQVTGTNDTWTMTESRMCDQPAYLFCFEID